MPSRVRGVSSLRRKLRRVEPEVLREILDPLRDGVNRMVRDARSFAPRNEGDLQQSIEAKFSRDGLTAVIGPGAAAAENVRRRTGSVFGQNAKSGKNKGKRIRMSKTNKHLYFQFLKGLWNEFGTKGAAEKNIPAQPARPFMMPAYDINAPGLVAGVRRGVNKALRRMSRGRS